MILNMSYIATNIITDLCCLLERFQTLKMFVQMYPSMARNEKSMARL